MKKCKANVFSTVLFVALSFGVIPAFAQWGIIDDGVRAARLGAKLSQIARIERILAKLATQGGQFRNARYIALIDGELSVIRVGGKVEPIDNLNDFVRSSSDEIVFDAEVYSDDLLDLGKEIYIAGQHEAYLVRKIDGTPYLIDGQTSYRITEKSHPVNYLNRKTWQYNVSEDPDDVLGDIIDVADVLRDLSDMGTSTEGEKKEKKIPVAVTDLIANASFNLSSLFELASERILILPGYYDSAFSLVNVHSGLATYNDLEELGGKNDVYCLYVGFDPGGRIDYDALQSTLESSMATDTIHGLMKLFSNISLLSTNTPVIGHSRDGDRLMVTLLNPGNRGINFVQLSSKRLAPGEKRDHLPGWWEKNFWMLFGALTVGLTVLIRWQMRREGEEVSGAAVIVGLTVAGALPALVVWTIVWVILNVVAGIIG
jgi:hypothetical protein